MTIVTYVTPKTPAITPWRGNCKRLSLEMSQRYRGRMLRLCLALWLFAFLAGASYALGSQSDHDGARIAERR